MEMFFGKQLMRKQALTAWFVLLVMLAVICCGPVAADDWRLPADNFVAEKMPMR